MALITRLARLWRADINALLDRLEAPDLVLSQAVREMEQALDAERRRLAVLTRELERVNAQEAACAETLAQTAVALDDCLAEGRDDLARPLIRRRLEQERQRQQRAARRAELETESGRCGKRIAERESQLADWRARAAACRDLEGEPDQTPWPDGAHPVRDPIREEDVEITLLQAKRQRGGAA